MQRALRVQFGSRPPGRKPSFSQRWLATLLILGTCISCQLLDTNQRSWSELQDTFTDEDFDDFDDFAAVRTHDPLSGVNRGVHLFNDKVYRWALDPVARGYRWTAPPQARSAVQRAFTNLGGPTRFANDLLQLEFAKAGSELVRLVANTTLGVGGLFDAADNLFDMPAPPTEDFGQTLATYGVGSGVPLVLPFLGPSNARDSVGLLVDAFSQPQNIFLSSRDVGLFNAARAVNATSLRIGQYENLSSEAIDPYSFFRDAYSQSREKSINE